MKLYRYFLARFKPKLNQPWETRRVEANGVILTFSASIEDAEGTDLRVVTARTNLRRLPEINKSGAIIAPSVERESCEFLAEHAINIMSVLESSSRSIASPVNCIAFSPSNKEEREFLFSSSGIQMDSREGESTASLTIEWTSEMGVALQDRLDGVAILAEALSSGGEAGKYRELIRFLELAFALPFYDQRMRSNLTKFLQMMPMGYTQEEIDEWRKLRHPSTHADLLKSKWIALTRDVRHAVMRMQQACFDVLFNKTNWKNNSTDRRSIWHPNAFTSSRSGHLVVRKGSNLNFVFRVLDSFGVHPMLLHQTVMSSDENLYNVIYQDPVHRSPER